LKSTDMRHPSIVALSELSDSSGSFAGPDLPDVLDALQGLCEDLGEETKLCIDTVLPMRPAVGIPQELLGRLAGLSGSSIGMRHAVFVGNHIHSGVEAVIRRILEDRPDILLVDAPKDHQLPAKLSVSPDDFLLKRGRAIGKSANTLAAFEGLFENERASRAAQSARPIVSVGRYRSDKERARAKAAKKSRRKNRK